MSESVEYRVWWIPQVPGKPFEVAVPDLATGVLLCDTLARYDLFQFEQRIKPDYCNVGGMSYRHPELTDGDWFDFDPGDQDEMAELKDCLARLRLGDPFDSEATRTAEYVSVIEARLAEHKA